VRVSGTGRAEESQQFTRRKLDSLNRNLQDYKGALQKALARTKSKQALIMIDDFYLIHRDVQPDVVDYLHRLLRGTGASMKIGTTPESRLDAERLLQVEDLRRRAKELRADVEAFLLERES
jgi:hypothetical protein